MLSNHADEIMETVAPDLRRSRAVENLFRALIEQTAKKQAIRRPQQFKELAAISNVDAQELRTIIDAFRKDGVSFLTPPLSTEIKDGTTIDIGHEALIRCWKKIADQNTGWLKRETEDGIRWSLLLAEAKEFAANPKRVLSLAKAKDVKLWLAAKAKPWCNRYGGNWDLVENLLKVSRRKANYIRVVTGSFMVGAFILVMAGIGGILEVPRDSGYNVILGLLILILFVLWTILGCFIIARNIYGIVARKARTN